MTQKLQVPRSWLIASGFALLGLAVGISPWVVAKWRAPPGIPPGTRFPIAPEVGFFAPDPGFLDLPKRITPAWQERVRGELRRLLRPRPRPQDPLEVRSTPRPMKPPEVTVRMLRCRVSDGHMIRAALLRPADVVGPPGEMPLIVALHGHGPGMGVLFNSSSYAKGIAVELARIGFLVLAIETRSFGGSAFPGLVHQAYVSRLRLQGREFHGQVLSDNLEILDWARTTLEHQGPTGLVGCSMGGLSAMFLAAFDGQIDACLVSGIGGSWRNSFASLKHCGCSIVPGLLRRLDAEQIFAAMSCRHLALELGQSDYLLGPANADSVLPQLRAISEQRGVELTVHTFDGAHEHDAEFVVDFFRQALLAAPASATEGG